MTCPEGPPDSLLLLGDGFLGRVALLFSGSALAQLLPLACIPLLTRLYTPTDFGVFASLSALSLVASVLATLRYEPALLIPEEKRDAAAVALLATVCTTCSVLGMTLLLALDRVPGIDLGSLDLRYRGSLWLLPTGTAVLAMVSVLSTWAVARGRFRVVATGKVLQKAVMIPVQFLLAGSPWSSNGLFVGFVLGQLAGGLYLLRETWRADRDLFRGHTASGLGQVGWRFRRFPLLSLPGALLNSLTNQLPVFFLAHSFHESVAGYYALSIRVLSNPVILVGDSVRQVFQEEASRLFRESGDCRACFRRTFFFLCGISLPVFLVFLGIGPWLFSFVFGAAWLEAGHFARILSVKFMLRLVVSPLNFLFTLSERLDLELKLQTVLAGVVACVFLVGSRGGEVRGTLWAYSLAYSGVYLVSLVMAYRLTRKPGSGSTAPASAPARAPTPAPARPPTPAPAPAPE